MPSINRKPALPRKGRHRLHRPTIILFLQCLFIYLGNVDLPSKYLRSRIDCLIWMANSISVLFSKGHWKTPDFHMKIQKNNYAIEEVTGMAVAATIIASKHNSSVCFCHDSVKFVERRNGWRQWWQRQWRGWCFLWLPLQQRKKLRQEQKNWKLPLIRRQPICWRARAGKETDQVGKAFRPKNRWNQQVHLLDCDNADFRHDPDRDRPLQPQEKIQQITHNHAPCGTSNHRAQLCFSS